MNVTREVVTDVSPSYVSGTAGSEAEKRVVESIRCGLDRRKGLFGLSLFLTLSPLSIYFTHGHVFSLMGGDALRVAAFDWSLAALFWFLYFARLGKRVAAFVTAISLTLIPIPFALRFAQAPGHGGSFAEAVCIWIAAAFLWINCFRQRSH